jgi:uncharacterized beta-barrel protein YwiB (DUF1934 family)
LTARPIEQIPVTLHVKTKIKQGNDTESYELMAFGRLQKTENATFLRYNEEMEVGNVATTIKLSPKGALILRSGAIKMRMNFSERQILPGTYQTPFGTMQIETHTEKLSYLSQPNISEGTVDLIYNLTIQGSLAGTYHMTITYKEEGK